VQFQLLSAVVFKAGTEALCCDRDHSDRPSAFLGSRTPVLGADNASPRTVPAREVTAVTKTRARKNAAALIGICNQSFGRVHHPVLLASKIGDRII
jgi:hypothetical protein